MFFDKKCDFFGFFGVKSEKRREIAVFLSLNAGKMGGIGL